MICLWFFIIFLAIFLWFFQGFPEFMLFWYDWHFPVWVCFIASLTSYADVSASSSVIAHCGVFLLCFYFYVLFYVFIFIIIIIILLIAHSLHISFVAFLELFVVDAMSTFFGFCLYDTFFIL